MTENEMIVWAAGLLDGEGYFSYSRNLISGKMRRKLRVRLQMTDLDTVIKCRNIIAPGKVIQRDERSKREWKDGYTRKNLYILDIQGFQAEAIMRTILPYMSLRRAERIRECLAGWDQRLGPVNEQYRENVE
jgi:hypothetical protein